MSEYADLDFIASNRLSEEQAWHAARTLGEYALGLVLADDIDDSREVYYRFDGLDAELCDASEHPDLVGVKGLTLYHGSSTWLLDRGDSIFDSNSPRADADYIGFLVDDTATYQPLLRIPLAPNDDIIPLLQRGGFISAAVSPHMQDIFVQHEASTSFYPRQLQAAAAVLRHIIAADIPATLRYYWTPEEHQAFLDEHFPYKDVIPTGGGEPIRKRAIASYKKAKTQKSTRAAKTVKALRTSHIVDLELPPEPSS